MQPRISREKLNRFALAMMAQNTYVPRTKTNNIDSKEYFYELPDWKMRNNGRIELTLPDDLRISEQEKSLIQKFKSHLQNASMDIYISITDQSVASIAIRGTDGLGDLLTDFDLFLGCPNVILHFVEEMIKQMNKLHREGIKTFYVTGHSLGGFLAILLTLRAEKIGHPIEFCQAFEAPGGCLEMVGNDERYKVDINTISKKIQNICVKGSIISGSHKSMEIITVLISKHFNKFYNQIGEVIRIEYPDNDVFKQYSRQFALEFDNLAEILSNHSTILSKAKNIANSVSSISEPISKSFASNISNPSKALISGSIITASKLIGMSAGELQKQLNTQLFRHSIIMNCNVLEPDGSLDAKAYNPTTIIYSNQDDEKYSCLTGNVPVIENPEEKQFNIDSDPSQDTPTIKNDRTTAINNWRYIKDLIQNKLSAQPTNKRLSIQINLIQPMKKS